MNAYNARLNSPWRAERPDLKSKEKRMQWTLFAVNEDKYNQADKERNLAFGKEPMTSETAAI